MRRLTPLIKMAALVTLAAACGPARHAAADAIVVSRAMSADTIAEIYVEEGSIRVELEIGLRSMQTFRGILPGELLELIGEEDTAPWAERMVAFFRDDWIVRVDDGEPLRPRVESLETRPRLIRDEITGEPRPVQPEVPEPVVFVVFEYALDGRPDAITIQPPLAPAAGFAASDVGFVVYHEGVAVNDFLYLGRAERLELDWDDPWFSRFESRNLRRRFDAPVSGFLYVDDLEVRREIVARPMDLQAWVDLGLDGDVIPVAAQGRLLETAADFLATRCPVTIDGQTVEPVLDRIHFIRRTLRTTGVIDPPEDLSVVSATLGVIYRYPVSGLPEQVTMNWDLFSDRITRVPVVATDEAGGLPSYVTPDDPGLVWKNFLTNPTKRTLVTVASPPASPRLRVPVASFAIALVMVVLALALKRRDVPQRVRLGTAVVCTVGVIGLWPVLGVSVPMPRGGGLDATDPPAVVGGLLANVYRAFDYRDESTIYDVLSRSADGELLTQVYLDTRRALELENQGGARARVSDVQLVATDARELDDGVGFEATCTWNVTGSIGHWGHLHQRRNQYEAVLTVRPVDGAWKITGLELLGEQRL